MTGYDGITHLPRLTVCAWNTEVGHAAFHGFELRGLVWRRIEHHWNVHVNFRDYEQRLGPDLERRVRIDHDVLRVNLTWRHICFDVRDDGAVVLEHRE